VSVHAAPVTSSTVVVAVDVGKTSVALSVSDAERHRLLGPVEFATTRSALAAVVGQVRGLLPCAHVPVKVGVEACGHYHRPLLTPAVWPAGWEILELNPAHVAEQRKVQGRRRLKTDAFDLDAMTEMLLAGHGLPVTVRALVIGQLVAWTAHRSRRVTPHGHEEPAARSAGPGVSRPDAGVARRAGHQRRPAGRRRVRRPGPADHARARPVRTLRRRPRAAGAAAARRATGPGRP
jgi:hypothetical protein